MARLGSAWASDLGQRLVTDFRAQNQMIEDTARGDPRLRAQGEERLSVATNFTKVRRLAIDVEIPSAFVSGRLRALLE